jgi:hypothetical protein
MRLEGLLSESSHFWKQTNIFCVMHMLALSNPYSFITVLNTFFFHLTVQKCPSNPLLFKPKRRSLILLQLKCKLWHGYVWTWSSLKILHLFLMIAMSLCHCTIFYYVVQYLLYSTYTLEYNILYKTFSLRFKYFVL